MDGPRFAKRQNIRTDEENVEKIPRSLKEPMEEEQTNLRDNAVYYMNCQHPVDGKSHWEITMQIDNLDDRQRKHLHRNGGPKKRPKVILASNPTDRQEQRAKGPGASLLTASSGRPVRGSRKAKQ
uniref:Uncharacterized protein n=1 Tax=Romanomermis culicivorax TaxID=13658 RepID=A0A915J9Q9_ROMCU